MKSIKDSFIRSNITGWFDTLSVENTVLLYITRANVHTPINRALYIILNNFTSPDLGQL